MLLIIWINIYIYRISSVVKVETDIITSITAGLTGRAVILIIMFVETFKTDIINFIGSGIISLDIIPTDDFQYLS